MPAHSQKKAPSQRQLRVGEEVRHAVSNVLMRNETHDPALEHASITVSEVRISPDLKNATLYVTPLAGEAGANDTVERLNNASSAIRNAIKKHIFLKYLPRLHFKPDYSFDAAGRINRILHSDPKVQADLAKEDEAE